MSRAIIKYTALGTLLQLAMVLAGHFTLAVANLFGPLGMAISLLVGLLYALKAGEGYGHAALGGAIVGGACALIGIVVSYLLGDVTALILALGTLSSAIAGALGGLIGQAAGGRQRVAAA